MTSFLDGVIRVRLLILAAALGVLTVGIVQLRAAPVDVLPEFTPPYAEIQTEALGLSAEEVEQLITVPLEADLLNGVQGVEMIRSESVPGLSSIVLVFEQGSDVYQARQLVEERLTQAHALPNVSKPPAVALRRALSTRTSSRSRAITSPPGCGCPGSTSSRTITARRNSTCSSLPRASSSMRTHAT